MAKGDVVKYECWLDETGEECAPTHPLVVIESDVRTLSRVAEEFAGSVWRSVSEGARRDVESAGEMTIFVRLPNGWVHEFQVEVDMSPRFEAFPMGVDKTFKLPKLSKPTTEPSL